MITINFDKRFLLPYQKEFIDDNTTPRLALVCGFGAGKSFIFIRKAFIKMIEAISPSDGLSHGWIIYPTAKLAKDIFIPEFTRLLMKTRIPFDYNKHEMKFTTKYGDLSIYTLHDPTKMVGTNLTYAGFDEFDTALESRCEIAWTNAIARLRGMENAQLFIVTTPEGYKVTYRKFVEDLEADPTLKETRKLLRGKTTDNPYLPKSFIDNLIADYPEKLREQYMNGEFVNVNGHGAYCAFDREKNCLPERQFYRDVIHMGIDFNVGYMSCTLSEYDEYAEELFVLDEFFLTQDANTKALCQAVRKKYPTQTIIAHPDMTGVKRQTSAELGMTDIKILKQYGFSIQGNYNPQVKDRLNTVNNLFEKKKAWIGLNCKRLIKDLEQVVTDKHGNVRSRDNSEDLTHISDGFGYKCWNLFGKTKQEWRY